MEIVKKVELLENTMERNLSLISNYDTKASIILSTVLAVLTIIFSSDKLEGILYAQSEIKSLNCLYIIFLSLSFFSIFLCLVFMFAVLFPRTNRDKIIAKQKSTSFVFFKDVATTKYENFSSRCNTIDYQDVLNEFIEQIYIISKICLKKHRLFKVGVSFLIIGCIFLITTFVIKQF